MDYLDVLYSRSSKPQTQYVSQYVRFLIKEFSLVNSSSLLELGSGNCDVLSEFQSHGFKVTGLDNCPSSGNDHDVAVLQHDLNLPLPFADCTFDIVFNKSLVEHLPDPSIVFLESYRVLKPGGKLIIMTPDWEVQMRKFYDDWTHKTPFTIYTMKNLSSLAQFSSNSSIKYFKQLPLLWKFPLLSLISNIIAPFIPVRTQSKLRWLRERQILACLVKP